MHHQVLYKINSKNKVNDVSIRVLPFWFFFSVGSQTTRDDQRRKYSKMDKREKDKLVRSPRENGGGQDAQKDLHSRTGRDEKKGKTQEKMERGSRKRFSRAGSKKMERVGSR